MILAKIIEKIILHELGPFETSNSMIRTYIMGESGKNLVKQRLNFMIKWGELELVTEPQFI